MALEMTLLIYYAILWHMSASFGWYLFGFFVWICHLLAHK